MHYTCHAAVKVVNINNATTEMQRNRGFIYKDYRKDAKYAAKRKERIIHVQGNLSHDCTRLLMSCMVKITFFLIF